MTCRNASKYINLAHSVILKLLVQILRSLLQYFLLLCLQLLALQLYLLHYHVLDHVVPLVQQRRRSYAEQVLYL